MAPDILRSDGEITNSNSCVSSSKVYLQLLFISYTTRPDYCGCEKIKQLKKKLYIINTHIK